MQKTCSFQLQVTCTLKKHRVRHAFPSQRTVTIMMIACFKQGDPGSKLHEFHQIAGFFKHTLLVKVQSPTTFHHLKPWHANETTSWNSSKNQIYIYQLASQLFSINNCQTSAKISMKITPKNPLLLNQMNSNHVVVPVITPLKTNISTEKMMVGRCIFLLK